jgi:ACS family tartrate transporter-like MFS transporter
MQVNAETFASQPAIAERTRKRVTRRLIPFLFLLYVVAYLDRVNLSFAGLEMTRELQFSNEVFGFGSGIFFFGYVLLEIPGTILVELWSARKWISRILITWGLMAALTGLIHTKQEFYWARFLLGVAEAGFFPGVIVYITHWFRKEDRAKATAMFSAAIPMSQIIGSPISALLLNIHWLGLSGWRWLLILEGLPAVVLGVITIFYLTDKPKDARWLPEDEREWLTGELERERQQVSAKGKVSVWQAFWKRDVILLTLVYFFGTNVSYGLTLWLPKMMQTLSGYSSVVVTLLSAIPYLATWPFMILVGWNSDRTNERRWHTGLCCILAGVGLAIARSTGSVAVGLAGFTLAASGIYGRMAPFWALPGTFLSGASAAAVVGSINCIANTGGFFGPYIVGFLTDKTGTYAAGVLYLIGSAIVAGLLVLLVRRPDAK